MERFEALLKDFKERPKSIKYHDVNRIKEELIKCCDRYTDVENYTIRKERLKYLYDKCDYIISEIANEMGFNPNYEPCKKDLEKAMERGLILKDVPQCDWDNFIESDILNPTLINNLKTIYDNDNKEAFEWCQEMIFIKECIMQQLVNVEDAISFDREVKKYSGKFVEPSLSKWINKDIINKDSIVFSLDKALKECTVIAEVVHVINEYGCIDWDRTNRKKLYEFLKGEYDIKGSYSDLTYNVRLCNQ